MGVPLLLTWLRRYFPHCFTDPALMGHIDNFYIDLNSLLYPAVNVAADTLLKSASAARAGNEEWSVTMGEAENAILQALVSLLEQVCTIANPQQFLLIASDGVSPMGKMAHQRARRQNSTARNAARLLCNASGFDIALLTCGSAFMERVSHAAHYFAVSYVERVNAKRHALNVQRVANGTSSSSSALLPMLTCVINDATSPGEGEHKIFEVIRAFRSRSATTYEHNIRHCVCSSDTDVIVSSLALHEPFMFALRFDPSGPHEPVAFSIQVFREALFDRLGSPSVADNFEKSLHDFVFVLLLFGNDFLPRISAAVHIGEGTLDQLIKFLADQFVTRGKRLVDETTGDIHFEAAVYLFDYLEEISSDKQGNGGLTVEFGNEGPVLEWGFQEPGGTPSSTTTTSEAEREAVANAERDQCYAYWTMLQWAMQYCCGSVPSWNFAYPYTAVPSLSSLRKHCNTSAALVTIPGIPNAPLDVLAQLVILTPHHCIGTVLPLALQDDYSTTIRTLLSGPFEKIPLTTVVQWCDERRSRLTPAETRRVESYRQGGVPIVVFWSPKLVKEDLDSVTQRKSETASRSGSTLLDSSAVASATAVTLQSVRSTAVNFFANKGGHLGKLNLASLPGLTPKTSSSQNPLPERSIVASAPPPPAVEPEAPVTLPPSEQEGLLEAKSFSVVYRPLQRSAQLVALSTIESGNFVCASSFNSASAQMTLTRGVHHRRVLLQMLQAFVEDVSNSFPSWKLLPNCVEGDVVYTRKRQRDAESVVADDIEGGTPIERIAPAQNSAALEQERLRKLREEQQKKRQQAQRELAEAREAQRLQQQLRAAFEKPQSS